jgi:hypothetical protein
MTERSRRSFLKSVAVSSALTTGAVLLPAVAWAAAAVPQRLGRQRPGAPQTRAATYRLRVINNSTAFEDFAVFQNDPDLGLPNVMPLAWFVQGAHPQTAVTFEWTEDYSLTLFEQDTATNTTQTVPVDPNDPTKQQVELDYADGAFVLQSGEAVADPKPGSIYLRELSTLPVNAGSIGIAIGGHPAYTAPAAPNMNVVFTPKPGANYWLAAGTFVPGEALDVDEIVTPVPINFPPGTFDLTAVLGHDNDWTVAPTGEASS